MVLFIDINKLNSNNNSLNPDTELRTLIFINKKIIERPKKAIKIYLNG